MDTVIVDSSRTGFAFRESGKPFIPVGLNYDHDEHFRLLEDYWIHEWDKVREDVEVIRKLGANSIRIHLQTERFLESPEQANQQQLEQLAQFIELARDHELYLNITGLGAYHKEDQPDWYTYQNEQERWETQAFFWKQVAAVTAAYDNIFCLNLINEPVIAGGTRPAGAWLGHAFVDGKTYTQFVVLRGKERDRFALARNWIKKMKSAVRSQDPEHLITIGLMDWSLERPPELNTGFTPHKIKDLVDFFGIHVYPASNGRKEFVDTVSAFNIGLPVVLEEVSHLECDIEEFVGHVEAVRPFIHGLFSFYTAVHDDPPTEFHRHQAGGMDDITTYFRDIGSAYFDSDT
jgi:hypothetical protein